MRRFIIICMALLAACVSANIMAKDLSRFLIRGYIYDKEYNAVDSVEVSLSRDGDTAKVNYKILGGDAKNNLILNGELRMMVQAGLGNYVLMLEKEGYEPLVK